MKQLSVRQAVRCEEACNARCQCRCHGALHGARRTGGREDVAREGREGASGLGQALDLAFFAALPQDDPHHIEPRRRAKRELEERAALARWNAGTGLPGSSPFEWPIYTIEEEQAMPLQPGRKADLKERLLGELDSWGQELHEIANAVLTEEERQSHTQHAEEVADLYRELDTAAYVLTRNELSLLLAAVSDASREEGAWFDNASYFSTMAARWGEEMQAFGLEFFNPCTDRLAGTEYEGEEQRFGRRLGDDEEVHAND